MRIEREMELKMRSKRKSEGTDTFPQPNVDNIRKEAEELLAKALAGDMEAIQRIWELVDGKPE